MGFCVVTHSFFVQLRCLCCVYREKNIVCAFCSLCLPEGLIVCHGVVSPTLDADYDFHLTGRGCAPPSPSFPTPSAAEPSEMLISQALEEPEQDLVGKEEEGREEGVVSELGDNGGSPLTAWETKDALNTSQDSWPLEQETEGSVEIMLSGPEPGEGAGSAQRGGVLTAVPCTNPSLASSFTYTPSYLPQSLSTCINGGDLIPFLLTLVGMVC